MVGQNAISIRFKHLFHAALTGAIVFDMGYSHDYGHDRTIPRDTWALIQRDAEKLTAAFLEAYPGQLDFSEITGDRILLNAPGMEFVNLTRKGQPVIASKYSQTHPADSLVSAIFSMASEHYPKLSVCSSQWFEDEPNRWPKACEWASEVLGRKVLDPLSRGLPVPDAALVNRALRRVRQFGLNL